MSSFSDVQEKTGQIIQMTGEKEKPFKMRDSKPAGFHFIQGNITGMIKKEKRMDMFILTNHK